MIFGTGGNTGILLSILLIDIGLHDTYFIISHFHFILSLGTLVVIVIISYYYCFYLF